MTAAIVVPAVAADAADALVEHDVAKYMQPEAARFLPERPSYLMTRCYFGLSPLLWSLATAVAMGVTVLWNHRNRVKLMMFAVTFVELWDYWIHLFAAKKFRTQQPLWLELGPRRDRSEQVPLDLQTIRKWLLVGTLLMIVNLLLPALYSYMQDKYDTEIIILLGTAAVKLIALLAIVMPHIATTLMMELDVHHLERDLEELRTQDDDLRRQDRELKNQEEEELRRQEEVRYQRLEMQERVAERAQHLAQLRAHHEQKCRELVNRVKDFIQLVKRAKVKWKTFLRIHFGLEILPPLAYILMVIFVIFGVKPHPEVLMVVSAAPLSMAYLWLQVLPLASFNQKVENWKRLTEDNDIYRILGQKEKTIMFTVFRYRITWRKVRLSILSLAASMVIKQGRGLITAFLNALDGSKFNVETAMESLVI
mmetsp:Transcript_29722/g.61332  ORF Transcript_29722/g.61332 Transcript_29722/m.61332 type:complete len:423 (+) Transcript_29722:79-1347(+)